MEDWSPCDKAKQHLGHELDQLTDPQSTDDAEGGDDDGNVDII